MTKLRNVLILVFCMTLAALASAAAPKSQGNVKSLRVYIEGDTSMKPRLIQSLRDHEKEEGLSFVFVEKITDAHDIRIVMSAEGTGLWNYAQGSAVVLTSDCGVICAVTRSNRLTAKGATNAVAKEITKNLHQYYGTRAN